MSSTVKTPYYRIVARSTKRDITQYVDSMSFEDAVGENDVLTLNMRNIPLSLVDEKEFGEGVLMDFHFGYLAGANSGVRLARVTNIEYSYDNRVSMTVSAMDLGIILRKGKKTFGWKDVSIKDLASSVANKNGLTLEVDGNINGIDELERSIQFMPQVNEDDFSFLKKTLQAEGTGDFIVFTRDDKLIIKARALGSKSKRTFTWNAENGGVLSFKPTVRDTSKDEASKEVEVSVIDAETGEEKNYNSKDVKNNDKKLGDKKIHYDVDGFEKKRSLVGGNIARKISTPANNSKEIEAQINSERIEASLKDITATLVIEGDPSIFSDDIITVSGVAKKHSGNWYVHKVKHSISKSGYITELELGKNAAERTAVNEDSTVDGGKNVEAGNTETDKPKQQPKDVKYDVDGFRNDKVKVNSTQ